MKLVDTEIPDPQLPPVPPPRPRFDKRRVSVSFLLTAAVLVGTVATVFTVFPARHNQLVTSAIDAHKRNAPWDLDAPDAKTLRAWTIAAAGHEPPLPAPGPDLVAIGARTESVLHRPAAVIRFRLGTDEITVVMQRARDVERRQGRRADGDLLAETWRRGRWTVVAVGPAATVTAWRPRIGGP